MKRSTVHLPAKAPTATFFIFDIKDPSVIQPVAILQDHDQLAGPRDIIISPDGSFLYIACLFNQSVVEVDIRNPLDPFIVRAVNAEVIECKPHSLAWVEEGILGACGAGSMGIIDFSGQEPKILGSYRGEDWFYNAYSGAAFTIIDLAGITNPALSSAWFLH